MSDATKDLILAIALVAFGATTLVVLAVTDNSGAHVADVLDFATLPRIYGWMLTALSVLLAANAWTRRRKELRSDVKVTLAPSVWPKPLFAGRAAGTIGLTALYVLGIEHLAFFPVTAAFLAAAFVLYGRRPLWCVALAALVGAAAMDVVFVRIISLPLH